ncbi:4-hydroxybenzoate octaprenyltransferase [Thiothrix subterranea]|uniref:4-hydroxybenzoate octaprenyltransferase n=1 Tax=Thiothrix subterranea TaxID=2735563 RepID=A0AA51MPR0_9GAMM|nr:4-hydroxybenzoate octaprenyltransferase [Thiothrix subterranea]MDQ5768282.1 4-hydroxybenzoate octaprenyltransferase [Thiothrix subterranea]WML87810.1 4-hydroxybenzoate octaprenyltransferase [Thiothrix subterranea]
MMSKWRHYAHLIRLDRPIGIYLLLWPTLWALWIAAEGVPNLLVLLVFMAGVVLMRSAGCAINDYADRDVDPHVARTKTRPLAAGHITPREALGVFAVLGLSAFALVLLLNGLTIALSVVAVLLAATYPFMKRFHHLPQVHLGAAFAWAIPMAFTAVTGTLPPLVAWLLFLAAVLWTTAYDTMYAMCDREDDVKIGVKSSAILFGQHDRLIIGFLQILTLLLLVAVGILSERGLWYWLGLLVAALFSVYQQWLIRAREPQPSLQAFLNNHWLGMAVFAGIAADYAF